MGRDTADKWRDAADTAKLRLQFLPDIIARIVCLVCQNSLEMLAEHHRGKAAGPQRRSISATKFKYPVPGPLDPLLEFEVQGCLIGLDPVLKDMDRLVTFIDLHGGDVAGLDIIGGNTVLTSEHVQPLDIELVYTPSVVLDSST